MFNIGFMRVPIRYFFTIRGNCVEKHLDVQPTPFVNKFVMRYAIIASHSAKDGEGAVVVVGFV